MDNDKIEDILSNMSPVLKKELLNSLVTSLMNELNEAEKKDLLQTVLMGQKESRELAVMVEH